VVVSVACHAQLSAAGQLAAGASPAWVVAESASGLMPLPAIDGAFRQLSTPSLPFRFDDGSIGRVSVETRGCAASDGCAPDTCGPDDSVLFQVVDASGQRVATWLRCAAYGAFSLVPVNLLGGSGDELMFVYRYARSSPPQGLDLTMWSLETREPRVISDTIRVAGYLSTPCGALPCMRWQAQVALERDTRTPRVLRLRAAFTPFSESMAELDRRGQREAAALRAGPVLEYRGGRYRVARTNTTGRRLLKGAE